MCTYAPLFAHVDAWQWKPDMIWFDNLSVVKTPNYYVQQLYAKNTGTNVLNLTWNKQAITGQEGLYASAVYDKNEKCYIVKVVNTTKESKAINLTITGLRKNQTLTIGECTLMQNMNAGAVNTLENKNAVVPQKTTATLNGNVVAIAAQANSFGVYKITE